VNNKKDNIIMISPLAFVSPEAKIGENVTIHPFAYIDKDVVIGDGCEIMPYASIMKGARLGKNNRVFQNAVISAEPQDFHYKGEDSLTIVGDNNVIRENVVINRGSNAQESTTIGNGNFIHEGVHISHNTKIGNGCVLGYGCKVSGNCVFFDCAVLGGGILISQGCRIGTWAFIQTGSKIRKDVPPYIIVTAEPAKYAGVNTYIGTHKKCPQNVLKHIGHAYRIIYQGNCSVFDALLMIKDQVPMSKEIEDIIDFVDNSKLGILK
jgi:UDP-N-acetylglucosamine acyltransferase